MKNRIILYSNNKIIYFLNTILFEYETQHIKIDDFNYSNQNSQSNIIIINNTKDADLINFKELNNNCLIISNITIDELSLKKNMKLLKSPITVNKLKNTIQNFVQTLKIDFHDISIDNEKITNLNNNLFCYLTKVEFEILSSLIRENETNKNYIKENILNIKSSIETNSLESHLTRIRKKMNKIKTTIKIQSKNDKLLIVT